MVIPLYLLSLRAADTTDFVVSSNLELQDFPAECYHNTIGFAKGNHNPVCERKGIFYHNGIVWKMYAEFAMPHVQSLSYLPPTLRKVRFQFLGGPKRLFTRHLPRMLTFCEMVHCDIFGTVDCTTLPAHLEILNLNCNRISGTVYLNHLPQTVQWIDFTHNPLKKCFVMTANLPRTLQGVHFWKGKTNVHIKCVDGADPRTKDDSEVSLFDNYYSGW